MVLSLLAVQELYSIHLGYVPNSEILTDIGNQCFSYNTSLTDLYLPKAQTIGSFAFAVNANLKTINLPSISVLQANVFNQSHNIEVADIGDVCTTITNSAFSGCRIDLTLIVRATTPPNLTGSFMLGSGGSVLSILVPATSVDAYKSAPNWKNYAAVIDAISS